VLGAGIAPQSTVILPGAVIVGKAAGLTVIILETGARSLPQASFAVHVSVTDPPHAPGVTEKVEGLEVPLIRQPTERLLLKLKVLGAGMAPQATVVLAGAVMIGKSAGLTVMILETEAKALPQTSVAVHVSVTEPPQASGVDEKVEGLEVPLIRQSPDRLLLKLKVLGAGIAPQATVIFPGAVIVGKAAGAIGYTILQVLVKLVPILIVYVRVIDLLMHTLDEDKTSL